MANYSFPLLMSLILPQDVMEDALVGASESLIKDLSVHVCFICMLHLANEHTLCITGAPSLTSLAIRMT